MIKPNVSLKRLANFLAGSRRGKERGLIKRFGLEESGHHENNTGEESREQRAEPVRNFSSMLQS